MKTFTLLSLVSALSVPSALAAEFAGAELPTAIDPAHLFAAFVVLLLAQIAVGDYTRATSRARAVAPTGVSPRAKKAAHPLAA